MRGGIWAPAWIGRHVAALGLVVAFLALGWWQWGRAAAGNALSWGYAFQWPAFAGFVIFVWAREVRRARRSADPPAEAPADGRPATGELAVRRPVLTTRRVARADDADPELAAYNDYLAWLNANPGARPSDYPGRPVQLNRGDP